MESVECGDWKKRKYVIYDEQWQCFDRGLYAWFPDPIVRLEYFFRRRRECGELPGKES